MSTNFYAQEQVGQFLLPPEQCELREEFHPREWKPVIFL